MNPKQSAKLHLLQSKAASAESSSKFQQHLTEDTIHIPAFSDGRTSLSFAPIERKFDHV
jgi:hypothetical protein